MRFLTPWKKISFLEKKTYKTDTWAIETVQDFLYDLDIKPHLPIGEIFAIYHVIVRPTKTANNPLKDSKSSYFLAHLMHPSCHILQAVECSNWCRTLHLYLLFSFQLQSNSDLKEGQITLNELSKLHLFWVKAPL